MMKIKRFKFIRTYMTNAACTEEWPTETSRGVQGNNSVSMCIDIATLCKMGRLKEATSVLYAMYGQCICVDSTTYVPLLHGCANMKSLSEGKRVHAHMIKSQFQPDYFVENHLVNMYAKCGNLADAHKVFDKMPTRNEVSWTAIISGYDQYGYGEEALRLFYQMLKADATPKCLPNHFTYASVLTACTNLVALEQGKQVQAQTIKTRFESIVFVSNALVAMYSKCGLLKDARQMFDKMIERDRISWNSMIAGYAEHTHDEEALKLFEEMQRVGFKPDHFTFSNVLSVCAALAALGQGRHVHAQIISTGFESDVGVGNALVDMYAKCGSIEDARQVFDKMPKRNIISWNAMIVGYAQHGDGNETLVLFEQMQHAHVKPNKITFVGILAACNHRGLVDEGRHHFDSMSIDYGIIPEADHYSCMVGLLGRAGCLDEAEDLINKMPFEPDAVIWGGLLAACRLYNNMELGKRVAEYLFELEPQSSAAYVALSNIYASCGSWDYVAKMRKLMKDKVLKKEPGCSWIEVKNKVHVFIVEDQSHPQTKQIYETLEVLAGQMKEAGYVPDTTIMLNDME